MLKRYLARLPLTDRATFYFDFWAGLCYGVFNGLAFPLIPIMARRIGLGSTAIAAMLTMQFVGALFGMQLGYFADRGRKMPFVVWPGVASRALLAPLAFFRDPGAFFVFASLFYLGVNLGSPAYASIMRSNYSDSNRAKLMGDIRLTLMLVSALCAMAAAVLLDAHGEALKWLFPLAAAFGVLSSLIFSRIRVRRLKGLALGPHPHSRGGSLRLVLGNTPLLAFMGIYFLCTTPDKLAIPLEPIRLVDELRLGYDQASFLLGTVVSLASIAGYYVWGRAAKRTNSYILLAVVATLNAARFAVLALAGNAYQLLPMAALLGLANAGWDLVTLFCLIPLTDTANFSLYFGLHTTLLGVRGIAGPFLGAFLYNSHTFTLSAIFLFVAGLTAAGAVFLLFFARGLEKRRREGRITVA
jgi:MFS family permease